MRARTVPAVELLEMYFRAFDNKTLIAPIPAIVKSRRVIRNFGTCLKYHGCFMCLQKPL